MMDKLVSNDDLVLIIGFIIYWITLTYLVYKSRSRKRTLLINLIIHFAYGAYFLYRMYVNPQPGEAMAVWLYLLLFLGVHWVINAVFIFSKFFKYQQV